MTVRIVTMADFRRLQEAANRLEKLSAEGLDAATDAGFIETQAKEAGDALWAERFSMDSQVHLAKSLDRIQREWEAEVANFTGERRLPGEAFENYLQRVSDALSDISKLDAMLKRNGIRFVFD